MTETSEYKFAAPISWEQINKLGVSALSDTPNRASYGNPGLNSSQLKAHFDQLVKLAIDRINSILEGLQGENLDTKIDLNVDNVEDLGDIKTLRDLAESITNGNLYNALKTGTEPDAETLDSIITTIKGKLADLKTVNEEQNGDIVSLEREVYILQAETKGQDVRITGNKSYIDDLRATRSVEARMDTVPLRDASGNIYAPDSSKYMSEYETARVIGEEIASFRQEFSGIYEYRGSVERYEDLPSRPEEGIRRPVYNVRNQYIGVDGEGNEIVYPAGTNFAWDGEKWDALGGDFGEFSQKLGDAMSDISALEKLQVYDHVIDKVEDFTQEKLNTMSGAVLVKDIDINLQVAEIKIPYTIYLIRFVNCSMERSFSIDDSIIRGTTSTTIEGLETGRPISYNEDDIYLDGFHKVKNCKGYNLHIHNCEIVEECAAFHVKDCGYVNQFKVRTVPSVQHLEGDYSIENCKCVTNVEVSSDTEEQPVIDIVNCEYASNIYGNGIVHYVNCKYVDGDTCKDYYTAEDVGKVQTITADGTKSTFDIAALSQRVGTTENNYLDLSEGIDLNEKRITSLETDVGNISTILTALHEGGIE